MPEKQTHDYKRNGTTALFAGLEVVTGLAGLAGHSCYQQHTKVEFLAFRKPVARAYPRSRADVIGSDPSNPGFDNRHPAPPPSISVTTMAGRRPRPGNTAQVCGLTGGKVERLLTGTCPWAGTCQSPCQVGFAA
jgi:hypothetical protein